MALLYLTPAPKGQRMRKNKGEKRKQGKTKEPVMAVVGALMECFEELEDPRIVNKCRHKVEDILVIAV
jgi:ribosomal protein S12 methylthiotransferase accessory factor YcaO